MEEYRYLIINIILEIFCLKEESWRFVVNGYFLFVVLQFIMKILVVDFDLVFSFFKIFVVEELEIFLFV